METMTEKPITQFIVWDGKYQIGHKVIDRQHQKIISMINQLFEAIRSSEGRQSSQTILKELARYTNIHFTFEEKVMRKINFPEYDDHKKLHDELMVRTLELKERNAASDLDISNEVLQFLKSWWLNHIQELDRRYTPFLG